LEEVKMKSSTLLVILVLQAVLVMGVFAAVARENGMCFFILKISPRFTTRLPALE
jgi:hypothetical protein